MKKMNINFVLLAFFFALLTLVNTLSAQNPPSPAPRQADSADQASISAGVHLESDFVFADMEPEESSSNLKGGPKIGISIGVIAGVCVAGLGALVYKKRLQEKLGYVSTDNDVL